MSNWSPRSPTDPPQQQNARHRTHSRQQIVPLWENAFSRKCVQCSESPKSIIFHRIIVMDRSRIRPRFNIKHISRIYIYKLRQAQQIPILKNVLCVLVTFKRRFVHKRLYFYSKALENSAFGYWNIYAKCARRRRFMWLTFIIMINTYYCSEINISNLCSIRFISVFSLI